MRLMNYDAAGNMTGGGTANGTAMTFDQTTNRMTAYGGAALSYDAAGNVVYDVTGTSTHTYQWNAENKMVSADGNSTSQCASGSTACYVYNALGQRVEMDAGGGKTEYLFDASGEELETCDGMMDSGGRCWLNSYVKLGGRTLANYTYTDSLFTHPDNIGSTGIVTNYTGAVDDIDLYYPFGAYWVSWKQSYDDLRFAGFQEMESPFSPNLYPTNTRKYNPDLGRWLTPDPSGKGAVTLADPQSWNMYTYVRNNPTTLTDPSGLVAAPGCSAQNKQNCQASSHPLNAAAKYHGAAGKGFLKAIAGAVLGADMMSNPITAPIAASGMPAGVKQTIQTVKAAAHGNPEAIGEVIGMASMAAAGAAAGGAGASAERTVLSGNGMYDAANGTVTVPSGTSVTLPTALGNCISDAYGGAIESGADLTPFGHEMNGATTYLPGSDMPNMTLYPPDGLHIMGNPPTVASPTNLDQLLSPNMGNVQWAACCSVKP